jgi:hypothetical protein
MTGQRHLLYVLALLEAALCLLSAVGQMVAGGSVLYLVPGFAIAALYIVAASAVTRSRRWGVVALLVLESVRLAGFSVSAAIGLLPWVELSLTGASLADGVVLPVAVILLAGRVLSLPVRAAS